MAYITSEWLYPFFDFLFVYDLCIIFLVYDLIVLLFGCFRMTLGPALSRSCWGTTLVGFGSCATLTDVDVRTDPELCHFLLHAQFTLAVVRPHEFVRVLQSLDRALV